jgi:hypothetical protein
MSEKKTRKTDPTTPPQPTTVTVEYTSKNLLIWNRNEKTNPSDTKPVEFGRKFTSIDAYSQIKAATAEFGPVGKGWGWTCQLHYPPNETIVAAVELWWLDHDGTKKVIGPVYGANRLFSSKQRPDDDAPKKAVTDGITKALSYLGFNADVFMGKFDDNKYVAERRHEEAAANSPPPPPRPSATTTEQALETTVADKWANEFLADLQDTPDRKPTIRTLWENNATQFTHCKNHSPITAAEVKKAVAEKVERSSTT